MMRAATLTVMALGAAAAAGGAVWTALPSPPRGGPETRGGQETEPPRPDPRPSARPVRAAEDIERLLAAMPFADRLPEFPRYEIPTEADCEWIIENGRAVSTRGLPDRTGEFLIGQAYRASAAAGHELPIDIGVRDDGGVAVFAGGWNKESARSVVVQTSPGSFADLRCRIVGLDDTCEVRVSWGAKWGRVAEIGLFDIGLRGADDAFILSANEGGGQVTIDGCWWLPFHDPKTGRPKTHASGMHIDAWERLIWRRHRWRGETPDAPGANFREHCAYFKSSRGETWILQNDLRGGNLTGFQIRPEAQHNDAPVGPVVIAGNVADGYGWNHGETPETFGGGSCITVWSNPNAETFVVGNRIVDAKYGCLFVGGQPRGKNFLNERGFPVGETWIWGNLFDNAQIGRPGSLPKRAAVEISGVERVHIGPNALRHGARVLLDGPWAAGKHGIRNGEVLLYEPLLVAAPFQTADGPRTRLLTEMEKRALRVRPAADGAAGR